MFEDSVTHCDTEASQQITENTSVSYLYRDGEYTTVFSLSFLLQRDSRWRLLPTGTQVLIRHCWTSLSALWVDATAGFQRGRGCGGFSPPVVVEIGPPAPLRCWTCQPAASAVWSSSRCRWHVTWEREHNECYCVLMCLFTEQIHVIASVLCLVLPNTINSSAQTMFEQRCRRTDIPQKLPFYLFIS